MTMKITECSECGCEFASVGQRRRVTCSVVCQGRLQSRRRRYSYPTTKCLHCGTTFQKTCHSSRPGRGKYCSRRCKALALPVWQHRKNRPSIRVERRCHECGATFTVQPCEIRARRGRFCSTECRNSGSARTRRAARPYVGEPSGSQFKESVRAEAGYRCQRCGRHQDDLSRRLSIHRVIPEDEGGKYEAGNVRALCMSCHRIEECEINRRLGKNIGRLSEFSRASQRVLRAHGEWWSNR
jgi:hypothetical protein